MEEEDSSKKGEGCEGEQWKSSVDYLKITYGCKQHKES